MTPITKLFDEETIARRVDALATDIAVRLPDVFTMVTMLKGGFVFAADLVRALDRAGLAPQVDFIRLTSYGASKESSGDPALIGPLPSGLRHRAVLLIDDILETGHSLDHARGLLAAEGAAPIWTCVLIDKPGHREANVAADFTGFVVDDHFVVGYGIDHAEKYRHLPYIGTID